MTTTEGFLISEHGGVEKLVYQSISLPELKPFDARIKVKYVGLNHLDVWVRKGVEGHKFPLPLIPGSDVVGEVEAVGELVTHIQPGQQVIVNPGVYCDQCSACFAGQHQLCTSFGVLGETQHGGCAHHVVVSSYNVFPLPTAFSPEQMAAFPLVFLTAWHMLVARAELKAGETILIQAAGSGVSSAAIQIAKFLGAQVITTSGSPEKMEKAIALGADHCINYNDDDWVKQVRTIVGRAGVQVSLDHVGEATFAGSMRLLSLGGRFVTCGATSGPKVEIDLRPIFFKGLSILGSTMGNRSEMETLFKLMQQKVFQPTLDRVLPLKELPKAHQLLEERQVFGKIVMQVPS